MPSASTQEAFFVNRGPKSTRDFVTGASSYYLRGFPFFDIRQTISVQTTERMAAPIQNQETMEKS